MAMLRDLSKRPLHLLVINPARGRRARHVRLPRCQDGAREIILERELSLAAPLVMTLEGTRNNFSRQADGPIRSASPAVHEGGLYLYCLSDPNAEVIRCSGQLHVGAGPEGHDVARPAKFLVDPATVGVGRTSPRMFACERADELLAQAKKLW